MEASTTFPEWVIMVSAYLGVSGLLWLFPQILHKKKLSKFSALHISHRGGSGEGYENTLKTFKNAIDAGTCMLELDVRMTKDGKIIVAHDEDLLRLTGHPHLVGDTNYSDIPPIKRSIPIEHVPDKPFEDPTWKDEERKIPQLIDIFRHFPHTPVNIDIKEHNEELIRKVSDLVRHFNRTHLTVWGSSNRETSNLLHKINPEIGLFFCTFKAILILLLAVTGLLPFLHIRETHFEVFLPLIMQKILMAKRKGPLKRIERLLFRLPNIFMYAKPFNFISHLKARGVQVYFWVCNEEDEFRECLNIGVTGIMTDYPTKLRQFLDERKVTISAND